jgi:hypothetical protein
MIHLDGGLLLGHPHLFGDFGTWIDLYTLQLLGHLALGIVTLHHLHCIRSCDTTLGIVTLHHELDTAPVALVALGIVSLPRVL